MTQGAAPSIKDLQSLSAVLDLCRQIHGNSICEFFQKHVHYRRVIKRERFYLRKIFGRAALNHVSGQRPGTTRKAY